MADFAANLAKSQQEQSQHIANLKAFKGVLKKVAPRIGQMLPSVISKDLFIQMVLTTINKNPKLLECTEASLFGALFQAATLGVLPDNVLGQAYLIPFNNNRKRVVECQFVLGYKGIRELAFRTGQVKKFQARTVFKDDFFQFAYGLDEMLEHRPSDNRQSNEITHFYAVIEFTNGGRMFEVMTKADVEAVRLASPGKNSDPWRDFYSAMGEKTVLRKLGKAAPLSPEFNRALELDEAADQGRSQDLWAEIDDVPELQPFVQAEVVQEAEVKEEEKQQSKHEKAEAKGEAAIESAKELMEKAGKKKGNDTVDS